MKNDMDKEKIVFKGSHPDSLYRVPTDGLEGSNTSRIFRALRWPLSLVVVCLCLAAFVYLLMPDNIASDFDRVNSTNWEHVSESSILNAAIGPKITNGNAAKTVSTTTRKPGGKTPEIDFYGSYNKKEPDAKTGKLPVAPVFPTHITPEVQYGNEKADETVRNPKLLDKTNKLTQDSTAKPHITQKPEKPLAVYFKDASSIRPTSAPVDTSRKTETTNSFEQTPTTKNNKPQGYEVQEPEIEYDIVEANIPAILNANHKFTSGHSKFFGIGVEDAEKMRSTTQSSLYNTRVSPTLPTWRERDEATTYRYPANQNIDVAQCHSPRLAMCRGVLPYDLAGPAPYIDGVQISTLVLQAQYMVSSNCSARLKHFLCSLMEPECIPAPETPKLPCYGFCKVVQESCDGFIPRELLSAFKCRQYQTRDCVPARAPCTQNEFQCGDNSCIPKDWRCDGTPDCQGKEDEQKCGACDKSQFQCSSSSRTLCIQREWLCDGYEDCPGGDDEDETRCRNIYNRRPVAAARVSSKPVANLGASEEEHEEAAGSAPAPSVRRPGHDHENRNRQKSQFRKDDSSAELLIASDSNNALKRNYTRRPSPSRLTPYKPKVRQQAITSTTEPEETVLQNIKVRKEFSTKVKLGDASVEKTTDNVNMDEMGIFEDIVQETQTSYPTDGVTHNSLRATNSSEPSVDKFMTLDGVKLYEKAAEEAKAAAELAKKAALAEREEYLLRPEGSSHQSPCPSDELRCVDGRCITLAQLCDGHVDCSDKADEDNCFA